MGTQTHTPCLSFVLSYQLCIWQLVGAASGELNMFFLMWFPIPWGSKTFASPSTDTHRCVLHSIPSLRVYRIISAGGTCNPFPQYPQNSKHVLPECCCDGQSLMGQVLLSIPASVPEWVIQCADWGNIIVVFLLSLHLSIAVVPDGTLGVWFLSSLWFLVTLWECWQVSCCIGSCSLLTLLLVSRGANIF